MPDVAYLEGLEKAGVDTHYLLTGERHWNQSLRDMNAADRAKAVLTMVIEVQGELGLEFTAEQITTLISYANQHCPTKQMLREFVELAVEFGGRETNR